MAICERESVLNRRRREDRWMESAEVELSEF